MSLYAQERKFEVDEEKENRVTAYCAVFASMVQKHGNVVLNGTDLYWKNGVNGMENGNGRRDIGNGNIWKTEWTGINWNGKWQWKGLDGMETKIGC